MVKVSGVTLNRVGVHNVLSGAIDDHKVYFRYPGVIPMTAARGEPFLGIALLLAMSKHEPLEIDTAAPLDPLIIDRLPLIQAILAQWSPSFAKIEVSCRSEPAPRNGGVVSSFSGGVDSCSTLVDHMDEITHLLTLNSFDSGLTDDFGALRARVEGVARALGKTSVAVETNARQISDEIGLSWNYAHGPVLCLTGVSMGFDTFYVPSSQTYHLIRPWGSHPSLDPLWSTGACKIIHDGSHFRRDEKIEMVASNPTLIGQLQVCWQGQTENCGRCPKCTRTMIVLNGLGVSNAPFPERSISEMIGGFKVNSDWSAEISADVVVFLEKSGHTRLARQLTLRRRTFFLKQQMRRYLKYRMGSQRTEWMRGLVGKRRVEKAIRVIDPNETL